MKLKPSAALTKVLATLAALQKLDTDRADLYAAQSHEITESTVAELEKTFGMKLPTDVLVLAALRVPLLERALGALGADASTDIDEDEWVIAWAGDPFAMSPSTEDQTYQQAGDLYVCLRKDAPEDGDPDVLVIRDEDKPREASLAQFLTARLKEHADAMEEEESELTDAEADLLRKGSRATADAGRLFAAQIVADERRSVPATRVKHAKFGAGTVVGESPGSDIVEVQFDSGDRKKLKRQFLSS